MATMNKETNAHHLWITTCTLLLVISLLGHTAAALSSGRSPPAPPDSTNDDPPPSMEASTPANEDGGKFNKFKIAKDEDVSTGFDIVFTDTTPDNQVKGLCTLTGFYDSDELTTDAMVKACFSDLSTLMTIWRTGGEDFFVGVYYWPEEYPYCAVNCVEKNAAFAVSSKQMSFVTLALALLVIIYVNYL